MREKIAVNVGQNTITGEMDESTLRFSAIAFAKPPIGPLRFKPPVPVKLAATLDATRPGPIAPQRASRLEGAMGPINNEQSEDCLHLTVWTPAADNKKRPVVIWLHGGAWQSGGGALDWYNGSELSSKGDIVVVAPNYRLAALGWLYVPGYTANIGLLDQEAAIDWVVDNIASFGGDPEQITVMGQSAGASSIACLLTRRPRFQRAIMQSPALGRGVWPAAQAEELGQLFMQAVGVAEPQELQTVSVQSLLQAQQAPAILNALQKHEKGHSLFCPVADGNILPVDEDAILRTAAGKVNVIIGYTKHEMSAFPGIAIDEETLAWGDSVFGYRSRQWAGHAIAADKKAWLYRFDFAPTTLHGACHCLELPFVFGTFKAFEHAPMLGTTTPAQTDTLQSIIQRAWIAFIRGGAPDWPVGSEPYILDKTTEVRP